MSNALGAITSAWLRPDTRRLALVLSATGASTELAKVVRDTFFLHTAGAEHVPYVYMAFSAVMVLVSAFYARAARKMSTSTLASIALRGGGLLSFLLWGAITGLFHSVWLAYSVFCVVECFFIFLPLTVWAVSNQAYRHAEGERVLPALAAFLLMGTVSGGLISRVAVSFIGPYNLLLLSAVGLTWAGGAIRSLVLHGEGADSAQSEDAVKVSPAASIWGQPIVRTLVYLAFPLWVLAYMIEYTYFVAMEKVFETPSELAQFLSSFLTICSLSALLIQVFITPHLVKRFGVATTCFFYPAALGLAATSTLVYGLAPATGIVDGLPSVALLFVLFARFLDMALYQSVYESSVQILYYAVPRSVRTQSRALIGGIVFPLSIACAGLLLAGFRWWEEPVYNVAFSSVVVGFLVVVMAMDIRPDYLRSLLAQVTRRESSRNDALAQEIQHLSLNEARGILIESLFSPKEGEASFAGSILAKNIDEDLLEDLSERSSGITEEAFAALTQDCSADDVMILRHHLMR